MKKPLCIFIFLVGLAATAKADQGVEVSVSKPYSTDASPGGFIIGLSWFSPSRSPFPGYDEYGITVMPPSGSRDVTRSSNIRTTDFVGVYAGHLFLPLHGLIRPGFELGWLSEGQQGQRVESSSRKFSFYYAMKLQMSFLTFLVSSKGIGGGFNFSL